MEFFTDQNNTQTIAKKLWPKIAKARIVFLIGELGAGKTYFVKQLGKALGVLQTIISPTFQLIKTYDIPGKKIKLVHIDLYRLGETTDLSKFPEIEDYLADKNNILLIEWGNKIQKALLPKMIIQFKNGARRKIYVKETSNQD